MKASEKAPPFDLTGGRVCLDFVNTLDDRFSEQPKELLATYGDLLRFAEQAAVISHKQAEELGGKSAKSPQLAQRALSEAIRMRETMFPVFWALIKKSQVPEAELATVNEYVQRAAQQTVLVVKRKHLEWQFRRSPEDLELPLWPIARSAAELLSSDQLQYVRTCASKTCQWFFLDESKNHRRRWCDMTKCGNRAKVRRFYRKQKAGAS